MGHDQLFKEILQAFLQDFLKLFYADVAERLDFETLRFLDKELFTDFPEGSLREVDLVAEIQTHEETLEIVLIHVEVQAKPEPDFDERMFQYYAMLWLRYRVPIFPIAVYLRGGGEAFSEEEHKVALFGREQLRFRYQSVRLAPLDARRYVKEGNPLAAALAALMDRRKAGEPLTLRALMFQAVARSNLDDAQKFLLLNLIETYFELASEQQASFRRLLSNEDYQEAREMEVTWADKMKEEGRQEGLVEGKRETLLRLLTAKFGRLPRETTSRVQAIESLDKLDAYFERALTSNSLDEMEL